MTTAATASRSSTPSAATGSCRPGSARSPSTRCAGPRPPTARGVAPSSTSSGARRAAELLELPARTRGAVDGARSWRRELETFLPQASATTKRIGVIDLTQPFEVKSLRPARTSGGDGRLLAAVGDQDRPARGGRAAGCTLLVDAETGLIRYQIEKRSARERDVSRTCSSARARASRRCRASGGSASSRSTRASASSSKRPGSTRSRSGPVGADEKGEDILEPGPVGEYVEVVDHDPASGVLLRAGRPRTTARSSRRTACRRRRATRSSTSRWSTPWRCARSGTSSGRSGASRSGRRGAHGARQLTASSTSSGCGSIRTRCARRTPTTARRRRRCCSATSRRLPSDGRRAPRR